MAQIALFRNRPFGRYKSASRDRPLPIHFAPPELPLAIVLEMVLAKQQSGVVLPRRVPWAQPQFR